MRILILALLLSACSPLDIARTVLDGGKGSGPSLEVDTTVGDKEESVVGQVGDTSEIAAESITGGVNTTYQQDTPPWLYLVCILGWMAPSPRDIYNEIKSWFKGK